MFVSVILFTYSLCSCILVPCALVYKFSMLFFTNSCALLYWCPLILFINCQCSDSLVRFALLICYPPFFFTNSQGVCWYCRFHVLMVICSLECSYSNIFCALVYRDHVILLTGLICCCLSVPYVVIYYCKSICWNLENCTAGGGEGLWMTGRKAQGPDPVPIPDCLTLGLDLLSFNEFKKIPSVL